MKRINSMKNKLEKTNETIGALKNDWSGYF